jgi:hypothetical protein
LGKWSGKGNAEESFGVRTRLASKWAPTELFDLIIHETK